MSDAGRAFGRKGLLLLITAVFAVAGAAPANAAKKRAQVIPQNLIGVWATDPKTCDQHYAEGLLKVEGNTMLFHASLYDVRSVATLPDGSVKLSGLRSEEGGETGRARDSVRLKFLSPDRFELIDHPEGQFYERCKKPSG
jgi:hypothetical protein